MPDDRRHSVVLEADCFSATSRMAVQRPNALRSRCEIAGPKIPDLDDIMVFIAVSPPGLLPEMHVAVLTAASSAVCGERFPVGRQRAFAVLS